MPFITRVNHGTVAKVSPSGNLTPGEPAGIQNDDILIMACGLGGGSAPGFDAAWTTIDTGVIGITTGQCGHRSGWFRYQGTSPSYTITNPTFPGLAFVVAYRYVDTVSPIDAHGITGTTTAGTTITYADGTPIDQVDMALWIWYITASAGTNGQITSDSPIPFEELDDTNGAGSPGLGYADGLLSGPGALGVRTSLYSASGKNGGQLILLKPGPNASQISIPPNQRYA